MHDNDSLHRRSVLQIASAFAAMSVCSPLRRALAQARQRTPEQILGPFYPVRKMPDPGGDLTHLPGKPDRAAGQVINVMGRVLDINGEPVRQAKIETWQANTHGRYTHPNDTNPAPLDPNFEGFAVMRTDAEGRYRFKTIKPGAYPAGQGVIRPPHIHFIVQSRRDKLVTQMYFDGESLNQRDPFLLNAPANARVLLIAKELPPPPELARDLEPDSRLEVFDIVILRG
ncbi:MAG TPA: protocatechuate 3,4-dioxygenase [Xanthobacteraceae bacterium]|nr:protocatechuate 3,4-dioxygenase [Xanthobacteraceae bacterium]